MKGKIIDDMYYLYIVGAKMYWVTDVVLFNSSYKVFQMTNNIMLLCCKHTVIAFFFFSFFFFKLVALRPSHMLVYLKDGSAQIVVHAATLR